MGRKARAKERPRTESRLTRSPTRPAPNWPLLALSAVGILLTAYISWTHWVGGKLEGCAVGSNCDVVLSSAWATLLGLPTALWGMLAYVTLAATAFIRRADRHWRTAWTIAAFGLLYSAYLTGVSLTILGAACPYCLTSFALMTTILAVVTYQRPVSIEGFSWPRWLARTVPVAALLIVVLHLNYTGAIGKAPAEEDALSRALAIHLSNSGVRMYGARWCPHCQEQKAYFGASASRLPYIECSTGGPGTPQTEVCRKAGISTYPTWVINGTRTEEVMSLQELASRTGFAWPSPSP